MKKILRRVRMALQVLFTGWCECELWDLSDSIAINLRNRFKAFRAYTRNGHPSGLTAREWERILKAIEWALCKIVADNRLGAPRTVTAQNRVDRGLFLLGKYFEALWD